MNEVRVIIPEREECDDDRKHPNSWTDYAIGWNACRRETKRLNAAPAAPAADAGLVEALLHHIEAIVHDSRVPNEVSQECAAVLLTARYAHRAKGVV